METFSSLLAICAVNSPVSGEFPVQRPVTRSFDVFFDLCPNKRLSKQSWGWWFETPSGSLWRHGNGYFIGTGVILIMRYHSASEALGPIPETIRSLWKSDRITNFSSAHDFSIRSDSTNDPASIGSWSWAILLATRIGVGSEISSQQLVIFSAISP